MLDCRLLELEDQIKFLPKEPQTTPRTSSTYVPQAYTEAISSNLYPQNVDEPPRQNTFTFCERIRPSPQPQALETSFEARVRDYMAAHTKRMERFKNEIFKQREEINDRMAEMFRLLKELAASRTLGKVLVREEARHHITKHVNSISLIRMEEEKSVKNNEVDDENIVDLTNQMLTSERPAEIDIRLSLASHSYIYPLGIAEDVLVEVAGYVYPVDFVILDIKEDEKRPFILGTSFLTTA
ncbi:hypothetical protein Tco_0369597 [Tanacetum coccineum]